MPLYEAFLEAFVAAYNEAHKQHAAQWPAIWGDYGRFSDFMLYDNDSVIKRTAPAMQLGCYHGEPLRLDAVFTNDSQEGWNWFPPVVIIEHENNPKGFHGEVQKLLSVRAQLKVGITYFLIGDRGNPDQLFAHLIGLIGRLFNQAGGNIQESPKSEYLFVVGVEHSERILSWYQLNFTAGVGVGNIRFEPVNAG